MPAVAVIILVILAGEQIRSASFSKITVPVCASSKMAEGADTVTAPSAAVPSSPGTRDAIKISRNDSHAAKTFFPEGLSHFIHSVHPFYHYFYVPAPGLFLFRLFLRNRCCSCRCNGLCRNDCSGSCINRHTCRRIRYPCCRIDHRTAVARPFASNT